MFYTIYEDLCKKAGKKPYAVAREIGLGNSNVAQWKKGSTPRPEVLQRIADYFGVTTGYLMGYAQKNSPPPEDGGGLSDLDYIRSRLPRMSKEDLATLMAELPQIFMDK